MRRPLTVTAIVAALLGTAGADTAVAGTRVETGRYYGPGSACPSEIVPQAAELDGCFFLVGDETSVDIVLTDAVVPGPVGGTFVFFASPGDDLASGGFCGSITDLAVPEGARSLFTGAASSCPGETATPVTVGSITATFSTDG